MGRPRGKATKITGNVLAALKGKFDALGISADTFAERAKIHPSVASRLLGGKLPSTTKLRGICRALEMDIEELLGDMGPVALLDAYYAIQKLSPDGARGLVAYAKARLLEVQAVSDSQETAPGPARGSPSHAP